MKSIAVAVMAATLATPAWATTSAQPSGQNAHQALPISTTTVECPVNPPPGRPTGFVDAPGFGRFAAYGPMGLIPIKIVARPDGGTELHFRPVTGQGAELRPMPFHPSSYDADSATTLDSAPSKRASTGEVVWSFNVQSTRWEISGLVGDTSWGEAACLYSERLAVTAAD